MVSYETVLTVLFSLFALLLFIIGIRTYCKSSSADGCSWKESFQHAAPALLSGLICLLLALWLLTRLGWLMLIVFLIAASATGLSVGSGLGQFIRKH